MKKFLKLGWVGVCVFVFAVYFVSCLTPLINPKYFSYLSLLAIAFPYVFIVALFCSMSFFFISKKISFVFLCFLLMSGYKNVSNSFAFHQATWEMKKNKGSLRIMTWNVAGFASDNQKQRREGETRAQMLNAISLFSPDILCLQEYHGTELRQIPYVSVKKELDLLGYNYSYVSNDSIIGNFKKGMHVRGVAIFSRISLIDSNRINLINTTKNENLIYTDIVFNNKPLRLITAHLLSFALYKDTLKGNENILQLNYKPKTSAERKIRETEIIHAMEVAHIRKIITASPYPVVYCGDINSTPASYTYNALKEDLEDAFLKKGSGLGGTFYKLGKTLRIDVCLIDKKLRVEQCTVPQLYISDHFPLLTDVVWN